MAFDFRGGRLRVGVGPTGYESFAWRTARDTCSGAGDYQCAGNASARQDKRSSSEKSAQEGRKKNRAEEIPG